MTEVRKLHECSIPVGRKGSRLRFNRYTRRLGAVDVRAKKFACRYCRQQWTDGDFCGAYHVDTITCSNCYGEDLVCTQVEAVFYAAGAVA